MQKLLETVEFSPNLTQLTLEASRLGCDPMSVLEKQPKLLILRLRANAYLGMKMQVSANGFPQLKVLQLSELQGLTELNIGEGAMPWLKQLQIHKRVNILGFIGLLKLVELNIIGQPFPIMMYGFWPRLAPHPWHQRRYLNSSIYLDPLNYQFLLLVTS